VNPYRRALVLAGPLALAACATPITLITPDRQNIGGAFSVDPGGRWNRYGIPIYDGNVEVWTLDGLSLNALLFVTGTKDGEPIFTLRQTGGSKGEAPPPFRSKMSALQIKELFGATLTRAFGTANVETSALRTSTFGGQPGFAFDTAWTGRDEVDLVVLDHPEPAPAGRAERPFRADRQVAGEAMRRHRQPRQSGPRSAQTRAPPPRAAPRPSPAPAGAGA
jgi:hypothetical protein